MAAVKVARRPPTVTQWWSPSSCTMFFVNTLVTFTTHVSTLSTFEEEIDSRGAMGYFLQVRCS
eukprot:COSAG01_NODE_611_length_14848_cov_207.046308_14_plen_63_part_00